MTRPPYASARAKIAMSQAQPRLAMPWTEATGSVLLAAESLPVASPAQRFAAASFERGQGGGVAAN